MSPIPMRSLVRGFKPYTAGLSIDEIREKYGIERVIKLASNENPLGTSPLVQHTLETHVGLAFRYPQAGNPRLVKAIAAHHGVSPSRIIVGDGSDEVIDLLFRICVEPGVNNAVAFMPCFGIYTTQAALCGVELRQTPVNADFSFPWDNLLKLVDDKTSLVFVTTPDNPSGYTPPVAELETLAKALPDTCLLVLDEAYMDFTDDEADYSLAKRLDEFPNVIISRTFSKSFGMAGLRLGYAIVPEELADHYWRVRLPFSVNLMAEEPGSPRCKTWRSTTRPCGWSARAARGSPVSLRSSDAACFLPSRTSSCSSFRRTAPTPLPCLKICCGEGSSCVR